MKTFLSDLTVGIKVGAGAPRQIEVGEDALKEGTSSWGSGEVAKRPRKS
jgi:hypothetical protein